MIVASTPAPTPRTRYQPLSSGCGSVRCPGTWSRGRHPTKNPLSAYATTDASIARSSAPDSNSMSAYRTSMAKRAAPTGDRKIAAMPAAIPTRRSRRRSAPVRPVTVAYHEPIPAAASAIGPSRPAEPPEPMVMADPRAQDTVGTMEGVHDGVGPVSFGLGCEPLHQQSDDQPAQRHDHRDQPQTVGSDDLPEHPPFVRETRG